MNHGLSAEDRKDEVKLRAVSRGSDPVYNIFCSAQTFLYFKAFLVFVNKLPCREFDSTAVHLKCTFVYIFLHTLAHCLACPPFTVIFSNILPDLSLCMISPTRKDL